MSLEEVKIGYITLDGWESTAYVTWDTESDEAKGTDKYSDEPVSVRWDDDRQMWTETHTAPPHPSPERIPGESDTATPMERESALEANGEPHD